MSTPVKLLNESLCLPNEAIMQQIIESYVALDSNRTSNLAVELSEQDILIKINSRTTLMCIFGIFILPTAARSLVLFAVLSIATPNNCNS